MTSALDPDWRALVPVLHDDDLRLRAHEDEDLEAIVEQCRDPETVRWTTVPNPYSRRDAEAFLSDVVAPGWVHHRLLAWVIEAPVDGVRRYCGSIELRLDGWGGAEVGFVLHPLARGRGLMVRALRLVVAHGFALGLQVIRWQAIVGNHSSLRVATRTGFRFEGLLRLALPQRGELRDVWVASLTPSDPAAQAFGPGRTPG